MLLGAQFHYFSVFLTNLDSATSAVVVMLFCCNASRFSLETKVLVYSENFLVLQYQSSTKYGYHWR